MERCFIQDSAAFRFRYQVVDERYEHLARELAGVSTDDISSRVDCNQRRPCRNCVASPDPELPVVDHWMRGVESYRCVANSRRDTLRMILSTVNAYYYQLRWIPQLELPQLREYMDAVNSPIGPEIQQNDFSAKIGELECLSAGVHPIDVVGKFRRSYRWCR